MVFRLFRRSVEEPFALYGAIVAQARHPALYAGIGVPDTLDGRFDMIVLHAVLVFRRLRGEPPAVAERSQALFDLFMADMDRSLRELGVGDLSVPKRIKKMAEAFYGRLDVYVGALDAGDAARLTDALARNVFPDGAPPTVGRLAAYVVAAAAALAETATADVIEGRIAFPEPLAAESAA